MTFDRVVWFIRAAAPAGALAVATIPAQAQGQEDTLAALDAHSRGDYETALSLWRPLAARGDPIAHYNLGLMYGRGEGVARDPAEAARWLRLAAEQGLAEAQAQLGLAYGRGAGVVRDPVQSARWLGLAADQGVAEAQYNLGLLYLRGDGVAKDAEAAARWMHSAAEHGDAQALSRLGTMYEYGRGVAQDDVTAYQWYSLGAIQGQTFAKERRDIVAKRLTPDQIAQAERRLRAWFDARKP